MCRECQEFFGQGNVVHLAEGEFMCRPCLRKDDALRVKHGLPKRELMIGEQR